MFENYEWQVAPDPRIRRRRLAIIAVVLAVAGAWGGWRLLYGGPPRLGPHEGGTTTGLTESKVGEWHNVFVGGNFDPHGPDPVRVRAVRVTGLPRGLRLVGVHALERGPSAGNARGDLQVEYPGKYEYHPVTDMVFREGEKERWSLVIITEALEPGDWETTGLDIDWSAGRRQGTTHYDYRVGMIVQS